MSTKKDIIKKVKRKPSSLEEDSVIRQIEEELRRKAQEKEGGANNV
jgi:hypothetical protein